MVVVRSEGLRQNTWKASSKMGRSCLRCTRMLRAAWKNSPRLPMDTWSVARTRSSMLPEPISSPTRRSISPNSVRLCRIWPSGPASLGRIGIGPDMIIRGGGRHGVGRGSWSVPTWPALARL